MSSTAPSGVARSPRGAWLALVGLALGLLCTVLVAAAGGGHDDMADMPGMAGTAELVTTSGVAAVTATGDLTRAADAVAPPTLSSACGTACADVVATTCAAAAAALLTTLAVLLLARARPDTFLGLRARSVPTDLAGPRGAPTATGTRPRSALCVWRV